jgi:pimeloyl-ACP methyl ester carboxylesterase
MLHGLGETERCWRAGDNQKLIDGLGEDGFSVLRLRYNTGRAVSDNGSDLADLIEAVRLAWPVPIDDIALIGHSMGGLVARSAVTAGRDSGHDWIDMTRQIVTIATPHLGSPIEKAVQFVSDGLGLFKESRPLSAFLEQRSAGIKNLREGVDDADKSTDAIKYHVVAGAVTTEPTHPLGILVGDLVVGVGSATGKGRQFQVDSSDVLVVGGRNHAGLIHDPQVISQTRRWLTPRP